MPERDLRARIGRIGPIVALLFIPGCLSQADAGNEGGVQALEEAGILDDGGVGGGALDAGAPTDAAGPSQMDASDPDDRPEAFDSAACFNGRDDDENTLADCEDVSCGAAPYCCVGSTSATCCTRLGTTRSASFATCVAADPRACADGAPFEWFGSPQPALEDGAFVPNGDAIHDSGLVLGPAVDPTRERVSLRATIASPLGGCGDCLDALAIGLADAPSADARVVPDIAVMVRASRRDYALLIAGDVVDTAPLLDADPHLYTLELTPDGAVALSVDGVVTMSSNAPVRAGLVPLLYGRTHNRDGLRLPARGIDVSVETRGCDIPSALARGDGPVLPFAGVDWGARVATSPSVAADGADRLVAFSLDRDVHLARRQGAGAWVLGGSGRVEAPALTAAVNESLRDPELVREANRWVLYATRDPADGSPTIARAVGNMGFEEIFAPLADVTLPSDASPAEAPAIADAGGLRWLAVRTLHEGVSVIALLSSSDADGAVFAWAGGDRASSIVVTPSADFARFDHDEVSDPDLVLDTNGLVRLFYGGRRGTRWSIGVRVSGDRVNWRDPLEGPVLAGSGAGHDSLWARHPSALVADGRFELFYTASNGVDLDIGRAEGSAP